MRCPYCGSVVEPARDTSGALFCPACQNSGKVSPSAARQAAQSAASLPPQPPGGPPGKVVASLALGIGAIVLFPIGLILGPLAIVYAVKGRNELRGSPAGAPGEGMATAGLVLGIVGIVAGVFGGIVVLSAVVFVLVSNLGEGPEAAVPSISFAKDDAGPGGTLRVVQVDAGVHWWEFAASGAAGCALPAGEVRPGDEIGCPSAGAFELVHDPSGKLAYATTFLD